MTKSEFVQRVAIALAGNQKFADNDRLDVIAICDEAERLAETFEERSNYGLFDDEEDTNLRCISNDLSAIRNAIGGYDDDGDNNIKESLADIRKYMNNPNDKERDLSTFQEIAKNALDIEGHLSNIASSLSEIADND